MTINVPLLRKAVEWVEEQDKLPEIDREWVQGHYLTEPEQFAFRLVRFTDLYDKMPRHKRDELLTPHCQTAYCVAGYIGQMFDERYRTSSFVAEVHVADYAADLLGLSKEDADDLFDGSNSAKEVRDIAENLAGCAL